MCLILEGIVCIKDSKESLSGQLRESAKWQMNEVSSMKNMKNSCKISHPSPLFIRCSVCILEFIKHKYRFIIPVHRLNYLKIP